MYSQALALLCSLTLLGASAGTLSAQGTAAKPPVQGAQLGKLTPEQVERFEALADSLPSPCGKAHGLRSSRNNDTSCKRAPFAVDYVVALLSDGATDSDVKALYELRFKEMKAHKLSYAAHIPHHGSLKAKVKVVEFYDYGCPSCKRMQPVVDEAIKGYKKQVVLFYKQFPLSAHPDSRGAAQAALAAHKQGKFRQMHDLLFGNQSAHKLQTLEQYANTLKLKQGKWNKDFKKAEALVTADRSEGEAIGVMGTPAIYINGRPYEGPSAAKYFKMWLDEAVAGAI